MQIPAEGMAKDALLRELASYKRKDLPWRSGKVWAYTYDPGEAADEVAKTAYMLFLGESGLDPTTFPSVHRIETEVVRSIANLLRGEETVVGNCTSGGTESVLCAVKAARDWSRAHKPHITEPEMVLPATAHPSFHKGCVYFGIKPVVTPFDPNTFQADVNAMRAAITDNTILIVGSAPGYAQGVADPIPEIAALAQERDILCHVDGCVGGIYLSFLRQIGEYAGPDFDWSVPGVTSISADMHKYGYAPKNSSVVMYRNKELRKYQIFSCRRTTTYALINPTILSTKSAGPMAASWAMLHFLGVSGYGEIVRETWDATLRLVDGINNIDGLHVLGRPHMCLFSFTSDDFNIFQLADEMRDRGWYLQPQFSTDQSPPNLHITVNKSGVAHVDALLEDLRAGVEAVKASENQISLAQVREQVQGLLANAGDNAAEQLKGMAGLDSTELPQHMALINSVMDALPDELAEILLTEFVNDLYV